MLPLSAGEIQQMSDVAAVTLAGTAILLSATKTSDGQGGYTWTYASSGTVYCHLSPENMRGRNNEPVLAGRVAETSPWILTVAGTVTVDEDDRVRVAGVTYEVAEVLAPRTWQITQRVRLVEVD